MIGRRQVSHFQEWSQVYLNTIYYRIASQNFGHWIVLLEATNWCVNIDKGLLNGVIFINLKKAFDMVSHEIVLQKLVNYGLNQNCQLVHILPILGINNVVSMAIYPTIVKLIVGFLKVL